ncbi:MAG: aldo/keto reductase [Thaumarchaeota archaeon]|nr:aldo/keto reductase [Candidatus Calditenuaceae archaeon]MDW8187035.1 aldo/keto reductase [Nitrososphaerota archaeon]
MLYTTLGKTSERVSKIAVGTWQIGAREWGWGRGYGEEQVVQAIRRSVEIGVNLIDTAEIYGGGRSEEVVGKAIKDIRESVLIATKVWPTHATYNGTLKACERSLRRLNVDVIDLYQVHWPNPLVPISSTMSAMEKLVREGKVRYIGVSNFSPSQLKRAQESLKSQEIVSNQVKYNLLERKAAESNFSTFGDRITVLAYSPLAQGLLTGKYSVHRRPKDLVRGINPLFDTANLRRTEPLIERMRELAKKYGCEVSQIALRALIERENVVAIAGVKDAAQAEINATSTEVPLSQEVVDELFHLARDIKIATLLPLIKTPFRLVESLTS